MSKTDQQMAEDGEVDLVAAPGDVGPARKISIAVGVVLVGLIGLLALSGGNDDGTGVSPLLQQRTPSVAGTAMSGEQFDIDDHRGSWVLANFFATWCAPCVTEHPELVALEQWGESNDLELVSVVFNDPVERVETFFAERGGTWPVLNEPSIPIDFSVAQVPETFIVSPSGQVVLHLQGGVEAAPLIDFIEASS